MVRTMMCANCLGAELCAEGKWRKMKVAMRRLLRANLPRSFYCQRTLCCFLWLFLRVVKEEACVPVARWRNHSKKVTVVLFVQEFYGNASCVHNSSSLLMRVFFIVVNNKKLKSLQKASHPGFAPPRLCQVICVVWAQFVCQSAWCLGHRIWCSILCWRRLILRKNDISLSAYLQLPSGNYNTRIFHKKSFAFFAENTGNRPVCIKS